MVSTSTFLQFSVHTSTLLQTSIIALFVHMFGSVCHSRKWSVMYHNNPIKHVIQLITRTHTTNLSSAMNYKHHPQPYPVYTNIFFTRSNNNNQKKKIKFSLSWKRVWKKRQKYFESFPNSSISFSTIIGPKKMI